MESNGEPRLIAGGLHVDARGSLSFVNDFDFRGVSRFYTIRAHEPGTPRGWIGHQRESRWFTAVQGTLLIAVVRPDRWEKPSGDLPVQRFVLSSRQPAVLEVPPGHATGMLALTADAICMAFASGRIEEARQDDWRFPVQTWRIAADAPAARGTLISEQG
jgi:dTDP-4-dehydrorhamnose 3,5-epimerase-like enzyme